MKKKLLCLLALSLLCVSLGSCAKNGQQNKDDAQKDNSADQSGENDSLTGDPELDAIIKKAQEEGPVKPEGMTEVWFDEIFRAFYPKQLADVYPTQIYVYGDYETTQPIMCFSSQELSDVELFSITDGTVGETLYTVNTLKPMESIVIQAQAAETADLGVRFTAPDGTKYAYAISRSADDSEIVLTELAA